MRKWMTGFLLALAAAVGIFWVAIDKDMRDLILHVPIDRNVLFWSIPQRDAAFRAMDRVPLVVKSRIISAGKNVYPLPKGQPLDIGVDVDAYMKD
ncbi:MAG: serine hydrolase, partial [Deltaproteobacteria bacterium HGW-Deltaproteobacteria-1]